MPAPKAVFCVISKRLFACLSSTLLCFNIIFEEDLEIDIGFMNILCHWAGSLQNLMILKLNYNFQEGENQVHQDPRNFLFLWLKNSNLGRYSDLSIVEPCLDFLPQVFLSPASPSPRALSFLYQLLFPCHWIPPKMTTRLGTRGSTNALPVFLHCNASISLMLMIMTWTFLTLWSQESTMCTCVHWRLSSSRKSIPFRQGNTWNRATKKGDCIVFDSKEYLVSDSDNWRES